MKIGVDARCLMNAHYSGVPEYTYRLLKEMLRQNTKHQFFLFYNSFHEVNIPFTENEATLCKRNFPNKLLNASFYFLKTPKIENLIKAELDVFWMPNLNFYPLKSKCPLVLTVHDLSFKVSPELFSWKRRLWHQAIFRQSFIQKVSKFIAVSQNTAEDLMKFSDTKKEKIKTIHSGISDEFFHKIGKSEEEKVISKYKLPKKFFLYLGTLEPRKNILGMIEAFELFCKKYPKEETSLVLAGALGWKYVPILEKINNSFVSSKIKYVGYIEAEERKVFYKLASSFIFPSFYEGFGFTVLEALSVGTPCVTSYNSSLGEIAGEHALLVDPYNVEEISFGMKESLHAKVLDQDIEKIHSTFSWEKTAKETLNVFENIKTL